METIVALNALKYVAYENRWLLLLNTVEVGDLKHLNKYASLL